MRRVVVTGLGMVTPLGVGVDHNWSQIIAGKTGIERITGFEVDDLACQIAGQVPGCGPARRPRYGCLHRAARAAQAGPFHPARHCCRATCRRGQRLDAGRPRVPKPHGCDDRIRHRRPRDHCPDRPADERARAAADHAILHSVGADQSCIRPCVHQIRVPGTEPCGCYRLFDRRARHRRCRTDGGA